MFGKKAKSGVHPSMMDTIIGEGTLFEGHLVSKAGIRIEGSISGDVESEGDISIGEKGIVQSNITARNVVVAGTVNGAIHAKNQLTITATGKVNGNISANSLLIMTGALFQGSSKMELPKETSSKELESSSKKGEKLAVVK